MPISAKWIFFELDCPQEQKNKNVVESIVFIILIKYIGLIKLHTTVRIAAGGGFENRPPGGNAEKKCDYKIIEKILKTSQAPNRS